MNLVSIFLLQFSFLLINFLKLSQDYLSSQFKNNQVFKYFNVQKYYFHFELLHLYIFFQMNLSSYLIMDYKISLNLLVQVIYSKQQNQIIFSLQSLDIPFTIKESRNPSQIQLSKFQIQVRISHSLNFSLNCESIKQLYQDFIRYPYQALRLITKLNVRTLLTK